MIVCGIGAGGTQSGPELLPLQTSDVRFRKRSNGWWGELGAQWRTREWLWPESI